MKANRVAISIILLMAACAFLGINGAQSADQPRRPSQGSSDSTTRSVWDGVYTAEQANRGADIAERECGECHGPTLTTGAEGPPLAGDEFLMEWDQQNLAGLFERMSKTMPASDPGKLTGQQYVDILAQILNLNKFPSGKTELEAQPDVLKQIRIEAKKPGNSGKDSQGKD